MKNRKIATDERSFRIRAATAQDLASVESVAGAYDLNVTGKKDVNEDDFARVWNNPRTQMNRDVWIATAPGGAIVGYEHCVDPAGNGRLEIDGFVHPEFAGRGIGSALLQRAVKRAVRASVNLPAGVRHFARAGTYAGDRAAGPLMEDAGFTRVRYFHRMSIELESVPDRETPAPGGFRIESMQPGASFADIHSACDEIFRDHWGNTAVAYDDWVALRTTGSLFDPSLWFFALTDHGEIAGISLCRNYADNGWIETLGVRRGFRGRGLGQALLRHSFAELFSRGQRRIELNVDADSPTGATRLYELVGMTVALSIAVWDLDLSQASGGHRGNDAPRPSA